VIRDVDPDMDVGCATEVPNETWAFQSPIIPNAILSDVLVGVKSEMEAIESSLFREALLDFVAIGGTKGLDEFMESSNKFIFLISRQLRDGDSRIAVRTKTDRFLRGGFGDFSELALAAIEHLVDLVCSNRLLPEHVAWMVCRFVVSTGCMSVEDGATQGHMVLGISVATESRMASGENKFELLASGCAENRETLTDAETSHVVLELFVESIMPIGVDDSAKNVPYECLLVARVEVAQDGRLGDTPIVGDTGSEEALLFGRILPVETNGLFLARGERVKEDLDESFRRFWGFLQGEQGLCAERGRKGCSGRGCVNETTAIPTRGGSWPIARGRNIHECAPDRETLRVGIRRADIIPHSEGGEQSTVGIPLWESLELQFQGGSGTVETRTNRPDGNAQNISDLFIGQILHFPKDENGSVVVG
jgi:hypothetical protein